MPRRKQIHSLQTDSDVVPPASFQERGLFSISLSGPEQEIAITTCQVTSVDIECKIWEQLVEKRLNRGDLLSRFVECGFTGAGLRLLVGLSNDTTKPRARSTQRSTRRLVLRLRYAWGIWPWDILPPTPECSKTFLTALVKLCEVGPDVEHSRKLLSAVRASRLSAPHRGIPGTASLITRDILEVLNSISVLSHSDLESSPSDSSSPIQKSSTTFDRALQTPQRSFKNVTIRDHQERTHLDLSPILEVQTPVGSIRRHRSESPRRVVLGHHSVRNLSEPPTTPLSAHWPSREDQISPPAPEHARHWSADSQSRRSIDSPQSFLESRPREFGPRARRSSSARSSIGDHDLTLDFGQIAGNADELGPFNYSHQLQTYIAADLEPGRAFPDLGQPPQSSNVTGMMRAASEPPQQDHTAQKRSIPQNSSFDFSIRRRASPSATTASSLQLLQHGRPSSSASTAQTSTLDMMESCQRLVLCTDQSRQALQDFVRDVQSQLRCIEPVILQGGSVARQVFQLRQNRSQIRQHHSASDSVSQKALISERRSEFNRLDDIVMNTQGDIAKLRRQIERNDHAGDISPQNLREMQDRLEKLLVQAEEDACHAEEAKRGLDEATAALAAMEEDAQTAKVAFHASQGAFEESAKAYADWDAVIDDLTELNNVLRRLNGHKYDSIKRRRLDEH